MSKLRWIGPLLALGLMASCQDEAFAATPPSAIVAEPPVNLMMTWSPIQQQYNFWPSDANGIPEVDCIAGCGGGTGGTGGGTGTSGAITAGLNSFTTGFSPDIGTTGDSAWTGTGNGSMIAVEKAVYVRLGTLSTGGGTPDVRGTQQTFAVGTAGSTFAIALNNGANTLGFQLTGLTASGATLTIEGSKDGGTTWYSKNALTPASSGVPISTISVDGPLSIDVAGLTNIRLRVSTAGTGSVTTSYSASTAVGVISMGASLPAGNNLLGLVQISYGGSAVSGTNGLPTTDTADGTPATGYTPPAGATGIQGELSDIKAQLTAILALTPALNGSDQGALEHIANMLTLILGTSSNTIGATFPAGSVGTDYSVNKPTIPNVGANFAASGPYASDVLLGTIPVNLTRNGLDIINTSTSLVVLVADDGTAASGAAPVNATLYPMNAALAVGARGDFLSFGAFKGRIAIYGPTGATVSVNGQ